MNTYTNHSQIFPSVGGLSNGGFVVCWVSWGQDDDLTGIFGQMYDSDGKKYGPEFQVNTYENDIQSVPRVCGKSDGGFVICWHSYGQDGSEAGVFAQIYDYTGTRRGEEFQVNTYTIDYQHVPDICELSDDGFVICWQGWGQDGEQFGIFSQIYNNQGENRGKEFQVNTMMQNNQQVPSISGFSEGGFVVCWESESQGGGWFEIFAQMYDNQGVKRGKEFQVNSYSSDYQGYPQVSDFSGGKFVICWESNDQDGSGYGIFGKYYPQQLKIHPLQSFSLIAPMHDMTLNSSIVEFNWQRTNAAHLNFYWEIEYVLYIDHSEDFDNPQIYSEIYDTTFTERGFIPGQTYFWRVLAKNIEGESLWSSETYGFYVSLTASIENNLIPKPEIFKHYSNYPNPFNPTTTIGYQLSAVSNVELSIYNLLGQKVATLVNKRKKAGYHQAEWDATGFTSGVYFLTLDAGIFRATQKMLLVR